MAKIAIVGCRKIQDQLCIACEKCLKAIAEKDGEFSGYDDQIELMALGNCGDCPGVIVPKIQLMNEIADMIGRKFDTIHLGTCVVKAKMMGQCPLDFDKIRSVVKEKFGQDLVVGTHTY